MAEKSTGKSCTNRGQGKEVEGSLCKRVSSSVLVVLCVNQCDF